MYEIHVNDRSYNSWEVFDSNHFNKIHLNIDPFESKLFMNDIFNIDSSNSSIHLIHSTVRLGPPIPGVLVLDGNKTYGRHGHFKDSKLLYKFMPDDNRLPSFLVPYKMKNVGFSKAYKNIYATIAFFEWNDKHPIGKLDKVIGPVDILDNFYEYQLYCKSLNASIQKFQKDANKSLENKQHDIIVHNVLEKFPNIQDRTDTTYWNVITIDPLNSLDYDDGVSLIHLDDGIKQLSIYISNVTIWMDVLNLWDSFSKRISTIYLPDKKRPMLPSILSDCLCSLQENVRRIAFTMDVFIKNNEIIDVQFCNSVIKVSTNYVYEEPKLLGNPKYHLILETVGKLAKKYKYINNVRNSHELVCYLMVLMNYHSAKELIKHKIGIFRSTVIKKEISVPNTLPEDVSKFITIWNSSAGQYIDGTEISNARHDLLDLDAYIHITSPIRRLVDLLNMIQFQFVSNMIVLSNNSKEFYNKWLSELDYINTTMRSIKKVQCDCSLLDLCYNSPEVMEKEYDGYLFDRLNRNDGLYQYVVFLPELKMSSRVTLRENFDNFIAKKFKLYLFSDEDNIKRKIRLQLL